jgi:hypothetical protein
MLRNWLQRRYLLLGSEMPLGVFTWQTAAPAATLTAKSATNSPFCHVTGAIYAGFLVTPFEPLIPYFQAPVVIVPYPWSFEGNR